MRNEHYMHLSEVDFLFSNYVKPLIGIVDMEQPEAKEFYLKKLNLLIESLNILKKNIKNNIKPAVVVLYAKDVQVYTS